MHIPGEEDILSASEIKLNKAGWRTSLQRSDANDVARWRLSAVNSLGEEVRRDIMISYGELARASLGVALVGFRLESGWAEILAAVRAE